MHTRELTPPGENPGSHLPFREKEMPKRKFRKIHFEDEIWEYKIKPSCVIIISPERVNHRIDMSTFTGWSWHDIERGQWKKYFPPIKPSYVKEYIEKNLKGDSHGYER